MSVMRLRSLVALAGLLMAALVGRAQERAVQILETPAGPGSGMYALTAQHRPYRDGRFTEREPILSWIDPLAEGGHALRFATLQGDGWSEPREVARGTNWFANWADHPSVVWAGAGDDMLAHWLVRSGNGTSRYGYGVRIARSTDGGRQWTPLFSAEPDDTQDYAGFVAFSTVSPVPGAAYLAPSPSTPAHSPSGPASVGAHVEGRKALVYTHFMPDGRVPTDVLDADTCSCCNVATAFAGGRRIVVYRDHAPGEVRDISIVRWVGPGWTQPTPVHADGWVIPGCPTNGPAVSADGDRVAVAWFTAAGETPHVRVALSTDGGASFGPPTDVDDGAPIGWAGVVLTDEGDAVVSWLEGQPGGGAQVRVRRVREKGGPGAPLVVATAKSGRATGIPQISRSGPRLILAWRDERVRTAVVPIATLGPPAPAH
jgi:hypothetical protein